MPVVCRELGVAYVSTPKCACSSLKLYFHELKTGRTWKQERELGQRQSIHATYPSIPSADQDWREFDGLDVVAVIRGPIPRLLSCYRNKVVDSNTLAEEPTAGKLRALGLPVDPDFETFLHNLDGYQSVSEGIHRHTQPLSHWLGADPSKFAALFTVPNINDLDLWMQARGVATPGIRKTNKSRRTVLVRDLSAEVREVIRQRYEEDFEVFGPWLRAPDSNKEHRQSA